MLTLIDFLIHSVDIYRVPTVSPPFIQVLGTDQSTKQKE